MSQWDHFATFAVEHEHCGGEPTLSAQPDEADPDKLHVTAMCPGCKAQLTLPVNTAEETWDIDDHELVAAIRIVSGKSFEEFMSMTDDEVAAFIPKVAERFPRLRARMVRDYHNALSRIRKH